MPAPVVNQFYNHGQEATPIDSRSSALQNIDKDVLQQIKNEMMQAVRQEIIQNVKQEALHTK